MAQSAGPRPDVIVIGAGLAGLACTADLAAAGLSVHLLEASDAAGGRMRTDRRDGFLLDRGFQVFNTSYPQVRKRLTLRDLRLHPFTPGVLVQTGAGRDARLRFTDPTRRPGSAGDLLPGRLASGRDLMALGVLSARDMFGPVSGIRRRPDRTTLTELADAGISDELVRTLFRPFLSGVFLEDELETSSRFFHLVWRSMLRGSLCLPAAGIGAVPAALAAALPPRALSVETPVRSLTDDGVLGEDGSERPAPTVVVATGPEKAAQLLPGLTVPRTRTVTTYYHVTDEPPLREPTLLVDTRRRFLNTVVLSEVAPACAPAGCSLVSTSVLGADSPGREAETRRDLAEVHATDTTSWGLLATCTVPGALPAMPPPWPLSRHSRVGPGRYVCGDHRDRLGPGSPCFRGARGS